MVSQSSSEAYCAPVEAKRAGVQGPHRPFRKREAGRHDTTPCPPASGTRKGRAPAGPRHASRFVASARHWSCPLLSSLGHKRRCTYLFLGELVRHGCLCVFVWERGNEGAREKEFCFLLENRAHLNAGEFFVTLSLIHWVRYKMARGLWVFRLSTVLSTEQCWPQCWAAVTCHHHVSHSPLPGQVGRRAQSTNILLTVDSVDSRRTPRPESVVEPAWLATPRRRDVVTGDTQQRGAAWDGDDGAQRFSLAREDA